MWGQVAMQGVSDSPTKGQRDGHGLPEKLRTCKAGYKAQGLARWTEKAPKCVLLTSSLKGWTRRCSVSKGSKLALAQLNPEGARGKENITGIVVMLSSLKIFEKTEAPRPLPSSLFLLRIVSENTYNTFVLGSSWFSLTNRLTPAKKRWNAVSKLKYSWMHQAASISINILQEVEIWCKEILERSNKCLENIMLPLQAI